MIDLTYNGTCNVIAYERQVLLGSRFAEGIADGRFILGQRMFTKEPLAFASLGGIGSDREWSDVLNWVLQALIFGEEEGLSKDVTKCQNEISTSVASKLPYLNAVYCMGNYEELLDDNVKLSRGMNMINNGTGLLYSLPFSNLDR